MRKLTLTLIELADALRKLPPAYKVVSLRKSRFGYVGRILVVAPDQLDPIIYQEGRWCLFEMPQTPESNQSKGERP